MPSQLLAPLKRFLDQQFRLAVMNVRYQADQLGPVPVQDPAHPGKPRSNIVPHWPPPTWGDVIGSVQSFIIHGTSGWPSYQSANNFGDLFRSLNYLDWSSGLQRWIDKRGIGPQYFVDPNGTAFNLIGAEDLLGDPRLTWHAEEMNSMSIGIENGDVGDSGASPGPAGTGPYWWQLSAATEDLTGMKAYVLFHPGGGAQDAVVVWFARFPAFTGAGDITGTGTQTALSTEFGGWRNTLFTERNYRTLAMLCRHVAEEVKVPKNFPLFPYLTRAHDVRDPSLFRKLIMADQLSTQIAVKLGTTFAAIQANDAAYSTWYHQGDYTVTDANGRPENRNTLWTRFFGANPNHRPADTPCFKGFLTHAINGGHPCPGPLFDWHRFAREVWDWWWYPFDIAFVSLASVTVSTTMRPYRQARRTTPLIEYYYDATGLPADYNRLRDPAPPLEIARERFLLPANAPVYAMANGVVVAARLPNSTAPVSNGFVLIRHEVFAETIAGSTRIDYSKQPAIVWSLITFLSTVGCRVDQIVPLNPDWLNRFVMRLKESELASAFWTTNRATAAINNGFSHPPSSAGPRLSTGMEIEQDATGYRAIADDLAAGKAVLFPLEVMVTPTPVRIVLGDYLGAAGLLPTSANSAPGQTGIEIEIFSKVPLNIPGAANVPSASANDDWWKAASAAVRHESTASRDLPADGMTWRYPMTAMLNWLNGITWTSEWEKYDVKLADKVTPAPAPTRPAPRIIL
ncbi:MAG: hypothetical protein ABJE10_19125 [bacterium]